MYSQEAQGSSCNSICAYGPCRTQTFSGCYTHTRKLHTESICHLNLFKSYSRKMLHYATVSILYNIPLAALNCSFFYIFCNKWIMSCVRSTEHLENASTQPRAWLLSICRKDDYIAAIISTCTPVLPTPPMLYPATVKSPSNDLSNSAFNTNVLYIVQQAALPMSK